MTTTKQSWLRRSLAVLLAVMMVMSMGVANVFAAGDEGGGAAPVAGYSTEQTENSVMSLTAGENTYYFDDIASAFASLQDNSALTLLQNAGYEGTESLTINKENVELNLNGHTLTIKINATVQSSTWDNGTYGINIQSGGLIINDESSTQGAVDFANGEFGILLSGENTKFTLEGGELKNCSGRSIQNSIVRSIAQGSSIVIAGGRIEGQVSTKSSKRGSFTMTGGEIAATSEAALQLASTEPVLISGGQICYSPDYESDRSGTNLVYISGGGSGSSRTKIEITGGTIESVEGAGIPLYIFSYKVGDITIGGGEVPVEIIGKGTPAMYVPKQKNQRQLYTLTIKEGAILEGETYTVELEEHEYENAVSVEVGSYFGFDTMPFSDSSYVNYPEGYVMNTKPVEGGEYDGLYTLATKENLGGVNESTGEHYTYQNYDGNGIDGGGLTQLLAEAQPLYEAGNEGNVYLHEKWTAFTEAYDAAVKIKESNRNANQMEIDYRAEQLTLAMQELYSSAAIDPNDLANGEYTVDVFLYKYNMSGLSMAAGAAEKQAKLIVSDDGIKLQIRFKPLHQMGLWGHMLNMWLAKGDTPDTAKENWNNYPEDKTYWNTAILSDFYAADEDKVTFNPDANAGKTEEYPYPGVATFELPYIGKSVEESTLYCRISVDAMQEIAAEGKTGDQNLCVVLNYSALEPVKVEPTLSLSAYDLSMMVGDEETVIATLKGEVSEGYVVTKWESSNTGVATVDNGKIKAVGEGSATITVTATKAGAADLTKTISVTVAPAGSEAVKVEKVEVSGSTETATLTGNFLTSGSTDGITVNGDTVTIDAKSDGNNITSSKVVIPQETAQALAGKTVVVETNTGSISLNSALLAQIAGVDGSVTLSIAEAAVPDKSLGSFSSAYELSLTNASGDKVEFGEGQATVTVTSEEPVNYAYCIDNGQRTERVATSTTGDQVSFTVSHFSLWALSDREYEVGGASTGFFLEDGNYYVDIALWKSDSNEASMGNVAFKNNDKALVTVKDGKITRVQIGTNPVDIDPYHSAIIKFELADGTKVTIEATGDLTTIPANKTYEYIKLVSFNLPNSAQPDISGHITYVPVNFYVPDTPMDAAVGETLTARLRFTWSTAVKTDDTSLQVDDTTAAGDSPITGEEIVDVNLEDKATGIKLETNSGILSDKAVLSVEKLTQGADYDIAKKAMNGVDGDWNLYKITTLVDGVETTPLGSVVLYIPCGAEGMTLYRVNADGTKTLVRGEVQDGYYVVRTTSLGLFAMVGEAAGTPGGTQDGNQNGNTTVPQTGDSSNMAVYALLALAAAGMMGVTLVTRKRKAEES